MADDQTVITPDSVPEGYAPFSTSSTDPSGGTKTTVGYAPRRPIQPPTGGIGVPDLGPAYAQAFQNLPVDQAVKAIEAATRFQGQRGYMRDIQNGKNAAEAFVRWAPMMFHQATGIPEALELQKKPAPKLHFGAQGEIVQENPDATYKVLRGPTQKPTPPSIHSVGGRLYRAGATGEAEPLTPEPPPKITKTSEEEKDAYKQLDEARKDMAKLVATPVPKKQEKQHQQAMDDATMRMGDARKTIAKLAAGNKSTSQSKSPSNQYVVGKRYRDLVYKGGDPTIESSWEKVK